MTTIENTNITAIEPSGLTRGGTFVKIKSQVNGYDVAFSTHVAHNLLVPPRPSYQVDVATLTNIGQVKDAFDKARGLDNLSFSYLDSLLLKLLDIVRMKATPPFAYECTNTLETAQVLSCMDSYSSMKLDFMTNTDIEVPTIPEGVKELVPFAEAGFNFYVDSFVKDRASDYSLTLSVGHTEHDKNEDKHHPDYEFEYYYESAMSPETVAKLKTLITE